MLLPTLRLVGGLDGAIDCLPIENRVMRLDVSKSFLTTQTNKKIEQILYRPKRIWQGMVFKKTFTGVKVCRKWSKLYHLAVDPGKVVCAKYHAQMCCQRVPFGRSFKTKQTTLNLNRLYWLSFLPLSFFSSDMGLSGIRRHFQPMPPTNTPVYYATLTLCTFSYGIS